jgi:hypothetical protein
VRWLNASIILQGERANQGLDFTDHIGEPNDPGDEDGQYDSTFYQNDGDNCTSYISDDDGYGKMTISTMETSLM